jgi:hypothetical protein
MRFVGRDHELAVLRAALHDASAAHGRLLFLVGDPGIGKTSLAAELADEATREGAQVLIGRADDGEGASPFWPWVQIVRGYLDDVDTETVRTELGSGAADVADVIPDVRERVSGLAVRSELPSAQARFRFFDSFTRKAAARRRPLVLVLDDLHWFDEPSLLLLRFLARDLSGARLLVIATTDSTRASLFARAVLGTGGEWWLGMGRPDPELLEEALGALAPGDSELRAQILSRLAVARYRSSGTQARGIALSQDAVEMARRIGDPATLALALHSRSESGVSGSSPRR